jgi:hypothetical protein
VVYNAGLCGDLVSVGTQGTSYYCWDDWDGSYCDGLSRTWLGYACTSTRLVEDRSEYQACIDNPAGCTYLYAARPSPCSVCELVTLSVAEWLGGWGCGRRRLSSQGITGTIPTNVGMLTSLTVMYASYHTPPCVSR